MEEGSRWDLEDSCYHSILKSMHSHLKCQWWFVMMSVLFPALFQNVTSFSLSKTNKPQTIPFIVAFWSHAPVSPGSEGHRLGFYQLWEVLNAHQLPHSTVASALQHLKPDVTSYQADQLHIVHRQGAEVLLAKT